MANQFSRRHIGWRWGTVPVSKHEMALGQGNYSSGNTRTAGWPGACIGTDSPKDENRTCGFRGLGHARSRSGETFLSHSRC